MMRVLLLLACLAALGHASQYVQPQILPAPIPDNFRPSKGHRPLISPPKLQVDQDYGSRRSCWRACPPSYGGKAVCCRRWGACC
ncbi:hyastatin-like [Eriocheir sinensis]|uniref:hyastatin-like n=1 Tax=Eriocheir sinensis TaxID=95602 RepID=UPI0021C90EA7|nr:hyastatin-like [Eriocheir sinensis]